MLQPERKYLDFETDPKTGRTRLEINPRIFSENALRDIVKGLINRQTRISLTALNGPESFHIDPHTFNNLKDKTPQKIGTFVGRIVAYIENKEHVIIQESPQLPNPKP